MHPCLHAQGLKLQPFIVTVSTHNLAMVPNKLHRNDWYHSVSGVPEMYFFQKQAVQSIVIGKIQSSNIKHGKRLYTKAQLMYHGHQYR